MRKRLLFALITVLACFLIFSACVKTDDQTPNDSTQDEPQITYTDFIVTSGNRQQIGFTGADNEHLVIPETFQGEDGTWYKVVEINTKAFNRCSNLSSVTIPDSVRKIGDSAFYECKNLDTITVPEYTHIGGLAFYNTGFYYSSSNWENDALYFNNKLLHVKNRFEGEFTVKDGTTAIVGGAFGNCNKITNIIIPESVTEIADGAFGGCAGITEFVIPETVKIIGNHVFSDCSALTSVVLPDGITVIGDMMFENCQSLKSITIPSSVTAIGDRAFLKCTSLTSITLPDSVTSIGKSCFSNCTGFTAISIPDNVTVISDGLFFGCSNLTEVKLPATAMSIGNQAFAECVSIKNISIPNNVTLIGFESFRNCNGLTEIRLPDAVKTIHISAFSNCASLASITLPSTVTSIASNAFLKTAYYNDETNWENGGLYLDSVLLSVQSTLKGDYTVKEGTSVIAANAFDYCQELTSIMIPKSVISIGSAPFSRCDKLTQITIEAGNPVFHSAGNCVIETNTKTLVAGCISSEIPDDESVTSIGNSAFDTVYIDSIIIPSSVTSIGEYAFDSSRLSSITIPNSVTKIGSHAFRDCLELKDITFNGTIAEWESIEMAVLSDIMLPRRFNIICTDGTVTKN